MSSIHAMKPSFLDEFSKIAGELQGFTRTGRRPIGAERLLEQEAASEDTPSSVLTPDPVVKLSAVPYKALGLLATGAGGYHLVRKANQDRQMGRVMRLQNNAYQP